MELPASPVTFQERKPIRGHLVWWLRFVGIVALIILLLRLPASQDVRLPHIDLRWLGFCMLLTVGQLLMESFVWQMLLASQRIRHSYPKTLVAYLASQYLGLVTPGRVGELLAAGYISMNTGITFGYALSSVVMKKLLSWVVVVGFGLWGLDLLAEFPLAQGVRWAALATVGVLLILAGGIWLWVVSLRRLARKWQKLSPWQINMTEFWGGMRHLASVRLALPLAAAAAGFSILFLQLNAVLWSLGIALPFVVVCKIAALSRIIARIIPLSVVGFGSKDAAVIVLLSQRGIEPAVGLTATLLFLVCSYLVTLLLSAVCWWAKPLIVRRAQTASS
ncbi:MAG: flippase-like domain-containing protein [Candidatus Omnitrophica bacterium]|nr:flippase-like domain-containing protein [Candidatus Omnitrophota bacterium]